MQFLLLPYASKAVHVTDVCPIVKLLPDTGSQVMVTFSPELSVAIGGSHSTNRVGLLGSVVLVWFKGQYSNRGSSLSKIETSLNIQQ